MSRGAHRRDRAQMDGWMLTNLAIAQRMSGHGEMDLARARWPWRIEDVGKGRLPLVCCVVHLGQIIRKHGHEDRHRCFPPSRPSFSSLNVQSVLTLKVGATWHAYTELYAIVG